MAGEDRAHELRDAAADAGRRSRKKAAKAAASVQRDAEANAKALLASVEETGRRSRKGLDRAVARARSSRPSGGTSSGELIDRLG